MGALGAGFWNRAGAGYSQFVSVYLDGILCASIRAFRCFSDPEELNNSAFFASLPKCALLFPAAMPKRIAGVKGMILQILLRELAAWCIVHENNQNSSLYLEPERSQKLPALISLPPPAYCSLLWATLLLQEKPQVRTCPRGEAFQPL